MTPQLPRDVLGQFLKHIDEEIGSHKNPQERFNQLMDWLAVEALESKELLNEIDLLLTLETEIEADCLQASIELPEEPEEIPAYRRPALETLLAKWRQSLSRLETENNPKAFEEETHDAGAISLAARVPDLGGLGLGYSLFESGALIARTSGELHAQRIDVPDSPSLFIWNFDLPPVQISYEGQVLIIRTVISELRKVFQETFPTRFKTAHVFRILPELRAELPGSSSRTPIPEQTVNSICRKLGWNVVFRPR